MKPETQNKLIIGIIFALLAIGVFALIFFQLYGSNDGIFEYNGFTVFQGDDNGLETYQIKLFIGGSEQPYIINSRFNPKDLEDFKVYSGLKEDVIKEELYVTMEPTLSGKATIAFAIINKHVENPFLFNLPTFPGLLDTPEGSDLPLVTCEDISNARGVIMFKIGDKNEIYSENGCVILEAIDEDELIRGAERLSLTILGIIS